MSLQQWREKYENGTIFCVPRGYSYVQVYGLKKEDQEAINALHQLSDCYKTFKGGDGCYYVKPDDFDPFRGISWTLSDLWRWLLKKFPCLRQQK
jgi:hypothetical protein